ncbi:hypothetical protein LOTGIDRAFT_229515 [Lottia gigantea]|uniref:Formin GTPase-binding domain-containing protein n=1 Tax=Lottia gigantea TaxID=225164 RepID=V3ZSS1_LOTGI|nr:hypothetical protein LOTGIDRAFT_229515 [Lottia gigantea]ESO83936.1 hypothetical protein LOTGIDRAFT_229515 [Lottia gigantea]
MIDMVVGIHSSMDGKSMLDDITNSENCSENSESEWFDDNEDLQMNNSELMTTDEKWKLIYSEQTRAPLHAVGHYINHIKKQLDEKGQKLKTKKLKDGIHPLSYLLRKLKLDLKMSYESFVSEFVRVPNNGLLLLVKLLKQLQSPHRSKSTSVSGKESRLEEYKRQLADEHDCLLCIKFTLRIQTAVELLAITEDNLQIIGNSLMSSTIKSRVATLENTRGDGLEYDDLRREIEEWKNRIIDVECLLRKPKVCSDLVMEINFDDNFTEKLNKYRQLPPIPIQNLSELPPSSIEMIMNILHRHHSQTSGQSPITPHRNSLHDVDDITSDYNTDQENYIAHVYKNTDESTSHRLDHQQQRRRSEDLTSRTKHDEENIYETLNTKPPSLSNGEFFDSLGLVVHNRRNSKKRLGSLNGNWILRTHLSMPSLNETTHNHIHTGAPEHKNFLSDGRQLTGRKIENECEKSGILAEPAPDYSPEMTRNSIIRHSSEAFLILDEFDEMLEKHDSKLNTCTTKRSEYVPPGTITYV